MSRLALFGGAPVRTRPFPSWPVFDQAEEEAVVRVLRSGQWWHCWLGEAVGRDDAESASGSQVVEFQRAFTDFQGGRYGVACANGSAALEVALKALGVGPGDEVIVPPYTFVATATAPLMVNAVPVFADIDADTLNLDPARVEEAITPRTKAVIPVHFAGHAADMEAILRIADRRGIAVLEDAAHAHGASWNNRGLGSIGRAGTFSFQASKNMTAGEGGLILTDDPEIATRCESYVWGGRNAGRPWYEHHRLGWNYRMTEFQAAILLQQLKRVAAQTSTRMQNGLYLNEQLAKVPGLHPLIVRGYATRHSFHIYVLRFDEREFGITRQEFVTALAHEGIPCSTGYAHPLYRNPMFLNAEFYPKGCPVTCGQYPGQVDYATFSNLCPNAERACREAVWFEHRMLLGDKADVDDIVQAVAKVYEHREEFRSVAVAAEKRSR